MVHLLILFQVRSAISNLLDCSCSNNRCGMITYMQWSTCTHRTVTFRSWCSTLRCGFNIWTCVPCIFVSTWALAGAHLRCLLVSYSRISVNRPGMIQPPCRRSSPATRAWWHSSLCSGVSKTEDGASSQIHPRGSDCQCQVLLHCSEACDGGHGSWWMSQFRSSVTVHYAQDFWLHLHNLDSLRLLPLHQHEIKAEGSLFWHSGGGPVWVTDGAWRSHKISRWNSRRTGSSITLQKVATFEEDGSQI